MAIVKQPISINGKEAISYESGYRRGETTTSRIHIEWERSPRVANRERVKVLRYNTHRGLPKGLTINCESHQMPTSNLMTTVIILKVRWIGEPWEWTRYSLPSSGLRHLLRRQRDEEEDEERSKTSTLGLSVSSDNEAGMFHVRLNVTEPRPISWRGVSTRRRLRRNGNPITTARDLIRIIAFTGNHELRSRTSPSPIVSSRSNGPFSSSKFELAVYHWFTCKWDERERIVKHYRGVMIIYLLLIFCFFLFPVFFFF